MCNLHKNWLVFSTLSQKKDFSLFREFSCAVLLGTPFSLPFTSHFPFFCLFSQIHLFTHFPCPYKHLYGQKLTFPSCPPVRPAPNAHSESHCVPSIDSDTPHGGIVLIDILSVWFISPALNPLLFCSLRLQLHEGCGIIKVIPFSYITV